MIQLFLVLMTLVFTSIPLHADSGTPPSQIEKIMEWWEGSLADYLTRYGTDFINVVQKKAQHNEDNCPKEMTTIAWPDHGTIDVARFSSRPTGSDRVVMILPPTGDNHKAEEFYAYELCRNGVDAVVVHDWTRPEIDPLDLTTHEKLFIRGKKAISEVLKTLEHYSSIGLMGTSVGGIFINSALNPKTTAPLDLSKIKAYFTLVSGGPICKVIASSDTEVLSAVRKQRLAQLNFQSFNQYQEALCTVFHQKTPKTIPSHLKFGMMASWHDTGVPSAYQYTLIRDWRPEPLLISTEDHVGSIEETLFTRHEEIIQFFVENL